MGVRIGTWNLENLFKVGDPGGPTSQAVYEAKLANLADTITRMQPDVLAVQEVGNPDALRELAALVGGNWHIELADAAEPEHPIRVAVLSRLPLTGARQTRTFLPGLRPIQVEDKGDPAVRPFSKRMSRPALRVRVRTAGGVEIDVVTCHLKSKLLTFPGHRFSTRDEAERARYGAYALLRRAAEAATVRDVATGLLAAGPDRAVIVLGDLNDEPQAATTQILSGPPGSEIGTGGFDDPDQGDRQRLWNLASRIPADQRFSRVHRGKPELIDHILVSHALVKLVPGGAVHTDAAGPVPSIADDPNARRDATGSDHRPVLAAIDV